MNKPKIYCFINVGKETKWQSVLAVAEDGHCLAEHISSCEYWAKHDIGLTSDWKHEHYKEHYPDGYELEWVDEPENHSGFLSAAKRNEQLGEDGCLPKDRVAGVTVTLG